MPLSFEALLSQAQAARAAGDLTRARELLGQAEPLQPGEPNLLTEQAHLLYALGDYPEAFKLLRAAMAAQPNRPDHYLLLGRIFREAGHAEDARNCYGACLELDPNNLSALVAMGNLLRDQRQTGEARRLYQRALALKPDDPHIQSNLAIILGDVGQTAEAIALLEQSLRIHPAPATHSNLLLTLHYDSATSAERLAAEHRDWAARHARGIPRSPLQVDRDPNRKLRLGFVSADLKQHPVGRLLEVLWRHLDRAQFELFAYDAGTRRDRVHEALRSLANRWQSIQGLDDAAAADLIRRDQVDVLFDLAGHSAGNRLLVFARKPAPMQVTWFGYPNTTGLEAVDWRLTDAIADPPGRWDRRYVEKLLYLPDVTWVYRPPEDPFPLRPLPCTRGEPFTFGCLNNPAKTSAATVAAWAKILCQVPAARLLLLVRNDPDFQQQLRDRFRQAGAAEHQLVFVSHGTPRQFYEYHYSIDLLLDPFPYNGAVTTADALWMGVPVLSLVGDSYASRQGVSLLNQLGLTDYLCASPDDYVTKAVALAGEPQKLAVLSAGLRTRLEQSLFMDYARFASAFGQTIRHAWRQGC